MLPSVLLPWAVFASLSVAAPEIGEDRGVVEVGVSAEVLYPPAAKDPRTHPGYGFAVSASINTESSFKAMVGGGVDHVVSGWLGDSETIPREGHWEGTVPRTFRGQLVRVTPQARLGVENDFAFGYFGLSPGYALRTAALVCASGPCRSLRATDHGLNLGVSLGALVYPSMRFGIIVGGEAGLDWAWFPRGHPGLAAWSQGMNARLIAGWRF